METPRWTETAGEQRPAEQRAPQPDRDHSCGQAPVFSPPAPTTPWCSGREQSCHPSLGSLDGHLPRAGVSCFSGQPGHNVLAALGVACNLYEAHKGCLSVREPPPPCPLVGLEFWSWLQQHDFCPLRSLLGRLARPAAATHSQLLWPRAVRQLSAD